MRLFSLLLCLLAVAALGWIIGSVGAPTATERRDAGIPKTQTAWEALSTGFSAIPVAIGTSTAYETPVAYQLLSAANEVRPHSTATIRYRPNQPARLEFIVIDTGRVVETPLLPRIGYDRSRRTYT